MQDTPAPLPAPQPDADSVEYWRACGQGVLLLRRCATCGHTHFPPRHVCPRCWSGRLDAIAASGLATVHTFTIMRRAPAPEFAAALPYVVALVDLDEGPRMMANIVGDDAMAVTIGERVTVQFEDRGEFALPQFRRANSDR